MVEAGARVQVDRFRLVQVRVLSGEGAGLVRSGIEDVEMGRILVIGLECSDEHDASSGDELRLKLLAKLRTDPGFRRLTLGIRSWRAPADIEVLERGSPRGPGRLGAMLGAGEDG